MYPYKVGQKVISIKSANHIKEGDICVVESVYSNYVMCIHKEWHLALHTDYLKPYFEVGDRVRTLDNNINDVLKIIKRDDINSLYFTNYGCYHATELKWMPEEKGSKAMYKLLKSFNGKDIKDATPDADDVEFMKHYITYLEKFGLYTVIGYDYSFATFIKDAKPEWIEFLLKHKFIEKIEKTYKIDTELTEDEFKYLMSHLNMPLYDFIKWMKNSSNLYNCNYKNESQLGRTQVNIYKKFSDIYKSLEADNDK